MNPIIGWLVQLPGVVGSLLAIYGLDWNAPWVLTAGLVLIGIDLTLDIVCGVSLPFLDAGIALVLLLCGFDMWHAAIYGYSTVSLGSAVIGIALFCVALLRNEPPPFGHDPTAEP